MHYYKFNIADWNLSTAHLSLEEEATYFRLINYYYDTESPIPLETHSVIRRLRLGSESVLNTVLGEFFTKTDRGYLHGRCEELLKEYRKTSKKNRTNGANGGRPRNGAASETTQNKPSGFSEETQTEPKHNPNQEPITKNQEPITKKKSKNTKPENSGGKVLEVFTHWQSRMNHPTAKLDAKRTKQIAAALKLGYTVEQLMAAIDGCAKSAFHMGHNDRQTVYDSIELIFRNADKIDNFIKTNLTEINPGAGYEQPKSNLDRLIQQYGPPPSPPPPEDYFDGTILDSDGGDLRPALGPVFRPDS